MTDPVRQWPDHICSGPIRYGKATNYDGFYLADVAHGIPTIGAVSPTEPSTIRSQHVHVFNYPGQTEAVAAQLVHRWNCHEPLLAALRDLIGNVESGSYESTGLAVEKAKVVIAKAKAGAKVPS